MKIKVNVKILNLLKNIAVYLMLAAESQGARLYRVNSAFYEVEGERRGFYSAVFVTEGGDFTGLLTFLSLSSLDYSAVGIYSNLE